MPRTTRGRTIPPIVAAARELRQEMTPSEKILWQALRGGNCAGLNFRRQHPIGPYVLDFFCAGKMLAIELDGAVHDDPEQAALDAQRTEYLHEWDMRVLRIRNEELNDIDSVLEKIASFAQAGKME